jgi:hypothetical protein
VCGGVRRRGRRDSTLNFNHQHTQPSNSKYAKGIVEVVIWLPAYIETKCRYYTGIAVPYFNSVKPKPTNGKYLQSLPNSTYQYYIPRSNTTTLSMVRPQRVTFPK